eukprot:c14818_g1_i1.p1 GENE.c14818_g1_i1~~c14818_g1_i1.p1  ORF type:complete len:353 (+),score=57.05 c14818_g1_i1:298-1356(+)
MSSSSSVHDDEGHDDESALKGYGQKERQRLKERARRTAIGKSLARLESVVFHRGDGGGGRSGGGKGTSLTKYALLDYTINYVQELQSEVAELRRRNNLPPRAMSSGAAAAAASAGASGGSSDSAAFSDVLRENANLKQSLMALQQQSMVFGGNHAALLAAAQHAAAAKPPPMAPHPHMGMEQLSPLVFLMQQQAAHAMQQQQQQQQQMAQQFAQKAAANSASGSSGSAAAVVAATAAAVGGGNGGATAGGLVGALPPLHVMPPAAAPLFSSLTPLAVQPQAMRSPMSAMFADVKGAGAPPTFESALQSASLTDAIGFTLPDPEDGLGGAGIKRPASDADPSDQPAIKRARRN